MRFMRFVRSERGSILLLMALFIPVALLLGGFVLDVGRAFVVQSELQNILDAATLAGANAGLTVNDGVNPPYCVIPTPEGKDAAQSFFDLNFKKYLASKAELVSLKYNPIDGDVNYSDGKIHMRATIRVPLTLPKMVGLDSITLMRDSWATCVPAP